MVTKKVNGRAKKSVKREEPSSSSQQPEEKPVYPPIPWYAGEEREYSRYTWKSKLDEAVARIHVQTSIFYEYLLSIQQTNPGDDSLYRHQFMEKLHHGDFYISTVKAILSFYTNVTNDMADFYYTETNRKVKKGVPPIVCSYLESLPSKKGEFEAYIFDNYLIQQFLVFVPSTSTLINDVNKAIEYLNAYRYQYMSFDDVKELVESNKEPYSQYYHPAIYAARCFETISDYKPTDLISSDDQIKVMKKLENSSTLHCSSTCTSTPISVNPVSYKFQSSCPCLASNQSCTESCACTDTCHNPLNDCNSLQLNKDLVMKDTWGLDCYTRALIQTVLTYHAPASAAAASTLLSSIQSFLQDALLPSINSLPKEIAHDLRNTLIHLLIHNSYPSFCCVLLQAFLYIGPNHFRIHPKGKGVLCVKKEGILANQVICRYLGEVFPPWAWYEKQDLLKQKLKELDLYDSLPEFYNIVLERPPSSTNGYDILYIDPIFFGNFGSRLSHSCKPNCATTTVTIDNKLAIVLIALRDIKYGEELTFDYSCVSESKDEFEKATCLCGQTGCRGSFVSYVDDQSFMQVMNTMNSTLQLTSILLDACTNELTNNDLNELSSAGIKSCMLDGCPDWLKKWSVSIYHLMLVEKESLPSQLLTVEDKFGKKLYNTLEMAQNEAIGVYNSRLQNLAITLDKIKYFLSKQAIELQLVPPLHLCNDEEVMNLFWYDEESVMNRLCRKALEVLKDDPEGIEVFDWLQQELEHTSQYPSMKEVKETLKQLRSKLIAIDSPNHYVHIACADCLTLYIHTHTWFVPSQYHRFLSESLPFHTYDLPCSCSTTYRLKPDRKRVSLELSSSINLEPIDQLIQGHMFVGEKALNCKEEIKWMNDTEENREKESCRVIGSSQKAYNKFYAWGQLCNWYKQNVNEPGGVVLMERRGCIQLPSMDSCYDCLIHVNMNYKEPLRGKLIKRLETSPSQSWGNTFPWKYSSPPMLFGSPMFEAIRGNTKDLEEAITELKEIPYVN